MPAPRDTNRRRAAVEWPACRSEMAPERWAAWLGVAIVARALPPCSVWAFAAANAGTASGRQMVAAAPAAVGAVAYAGEAA